LLLLLQVLDLTIQLVLIHQLPLPQFVRLFLLVVLINLILMLEHCRPFIENLFSGFDWQVSFLKTSGIGCIKVLPPHYFRRVLSLKNGLLQAGRTVHSMHLLGSQGLLMRPHKGHIV